jgi:hypothetical protein
MTAPVLCMSKPAFDISSEYKIEAFTVSFRNLRSSYPWNAPFEIHSICSRDITQSLIGAELSSDIETALICTKEYNYTTQASPTSARQ